MVARVVGMAVVALLLMSCGAPAPSPPATTVASPPPASTPAPGPPAASPTSASTASPAAASGGPTTSAGLLLTGAVTPGFVLQSSAFQAGGAIPTEYTCAGAGQSPPLSWSGVPSGTKDLVLVIQDQDVPPPNGPFLHWMVVNLAPEPAQLAAALPADATPNGAQQGPSGSKAPGFLRPCPPKGGAAHHYAFQLFALDGPVALKSDTTVADLRTAMTGHVVGQTLLLAQFAQQ